MNTVIALFNPGSNKTTTAFRYQYDYGQRLQFAGIELPATYMVHFSNYIDNVAKKVLGDETGVDIPDEYLETGLPVYAWVYLHSGENDGETVYEVTIPVRKRSEPVDEEPTPAQQSIIDQLVAGLEDLREDTEAAMPVVNLLPSVYWREDIENPHVSNGITWTVNPDGSVTANGTCTAEGAENYRLSGDVTSGTGSQVQPVLMDPDKKYTVSSGSSGATASTCWMILRCYEPGETTYTSVFVYDTPAVITGYDRVYAALGIRSGVTVSNFTWFPQIETGEEAHEYVSTHNGTYSLNKKLSGGHIVFTATNSISFSNDITLYTGRLSAATIYSVEQVGDSGMYKYELLLNASEGQMIYHATEKPLLVGDVYVNNAGVSAPASMQVEGEAGAWNHIRVTFYYPSPSLTGTCTVDFIGFIRYHIGG